MTAKKSPKYTTLYDPNQPGRERVVLESEASRWKSAGWQDSPPAPKAPEKDETAQAKSS